MYSNSKDTSLFYKTQNLYYVKSDTLYQSLTLSDEKQSYEVVFDASEYKQNADNTKNKIIFKFVGVESVNGETNDEDKAQILIKVSNQKDLFPELNNVFKQNSNEFSEEFLKDLKQNTILKDSKIKINEEELKKIFRSYKKQAEIDFFIHKNATAFLKEQFDLWAYHYLFKDSDIQEWNPEIIAHLQRIKNIAYEVIKLIGDFENELKAVWLKPKFAKKVEYVFSVDKLNPNLMDSIINDKGFKSQIKEWQELNLVDEDFKKEDLLSNDTYRYLPIDTKHFNKATKYQILSSFEDLESLLNGELIKADNFQALNSLMPKYQGKVDLIYIDPPYNTGSDGFIYADNFNHASWLSMMNNRLELSKELLNNKGSLFISIDDKEQARLKLVCDEVFGEENFVANFVWNHRKSGQNDIDFTLSYNYNLSYAKDRNSFKFQRLEAKTDKFSNTDNDTRGEWIADPFDAPNIRENLSYPITNPNTKEVFYPPKGRCWRMSEEKFYEALKDNRIIFGKNGTSRPQYKRFKFEAETKGENINTIWLDVGTATEATKEIQNIFNDKIFDTPKPEKLLKRICEIATKADSKTTPIVLDFFAGSGTTLAAAQKLGRKWIGVEMGEHFYNVIIPRIKKVIAGFQSGISKECDYKGSGAFRYYELEFYEEALANCEYVLDYKEAKKTDNKNNYKGKDYAKAKVILDYRKSRKLIDNLSKGESVCLDMHTEYREGFDIFHTMANLMGWKIKRLFLDSKGIESCEFDNGEILNLDSLDLAKYPKLKNLIWWE